MKMEMTREFRKMICDDIERLAQSSELPNCQKLKLLREIDGRYQECVGNWFSGLSNANGSLTRIRYEELEELSERNSRCIQNDLDMMKAKLETLRYGMNSNSHPQILTNQVNVTTNVSLNMTFEQARSKVEEMDSLTEEQTREALKKIDEIERIIQSSDSKKTKWEKTKPVLAWIADKSYDLGKTILLLLLKIE